MESNWFSNIITLEKTSDWYFEEFIRQSVEKYLKSNGYKIHKEFSERGDKLITASRYFRKELIEIKGFPASYYTNDTSKAPQKNDNTAHQAKSWFFEALFNSFINFGKYYNHENVVVAMALPNVGRYKTIINRLQDYFTLNNRYFKMYLVNEDGSVEVSNLNELYMKQIDKNSPL